MPNTRSCRLTIYPSPTTFWSNKRPSPKVLRNLANFREIWRRFKIPYLPLSNNLPKRMRKYCVWGLGFQNPRFWLRLKGAKLTLQRVIRTDYGSRYQLWRLMLQNWRRIKSTLKPWRGRKQLNTSNLSFNLIWLLIGQGPRRVHSSLQWMQFLLLILTWNGLTLYLFWLQILR